MGWELYSHKKTLNDGRQIPGYSACNRVHGLRIMTLGVASFSLWIAGRVWPLPQ